MTASLHILKSPLGSADARHLLIDSGLTLHDLFSDLAPRYRPGPDQPVMAIVDGNHIEPQEWASFVVPAYADVIVCPRPYGIDPFTWFIIVVVSIASAYLATQLVQAPSSQQSPQQSPTYSLTAQGNQARLGQPIPVRYGRFRIFPDFASAPYREYIGQDEFLYQLFAIGQGSYAYESLQIGDTPIGSYDDVEWAFYEPGQSITLFPAGVHSSTEVSGNGITLFAPNDPDYPGISGPFVANLADTDAITLAVDIMYPRGLNYANDDGGLDPVSVTTLFEYRAIDAAGAPISPGTWLTLANDTRAAATVDVLRYTLRKDVPAGRYEVRARRTTIGVDNFRQNDEVHWVGLRAYLQGDLTFAHSTWAVKCRATDQLSAQSERKFNCVATRKLPIWNGSAWTAATATRNPAWAFCDAIRAEYGGNYSASHLELAAIKAVADTWAARGDYFDGQYDTKSTLWATLQQICAAGRATPYQYGEQFSIIRDDGNPAGVYMFNGRNIVRGSMTVTYNTMDQWADDSVRVEYIDPTTWLPDPILCEIPGITAQQPREVKLFGVTDRMQAFREGMFLAAKMAFRTVAAEFQTELDGRIPQYLDRLLLAHEVYDWGQGGEVIAVAGDVLTLSRPVVFDPSSNVIWLRGDRGEASGPYDIAAVSGQPSKVRLLDSPSITIRTGDARARTFFAIAHGSITPRQMLLDQVEHSDGLQVTIRALLDDPRAHQYDAMIDDGELVPPDPTPAPVATDLSILGLTIIQGGIVDAPRLRVAWQPVPSAKRYFVEISYDNGATWTRATVETNFADLDVHAGEIKVRVAAQSDDSIGPWFGATVTAGADFSPPPTPSGLSLVGGAFSGPVLQLQWGTDVAAVAWRVVYKLAGVVKFGQRAVTPAASLDYSTARLNGLGREFDVEVYGVNTNGVESAVPATLHVKNLQTAALSGIIVTSMPDQIMVQWNAPVEADNEAFKIYASTDPDFEPGPETLVEPYARTLIYGFPATSDEIWYVVVAGFDVWGIDELNFSDVYVASGKEIVATEIADDSVSTPKLQANAVTAAKIFVTTLSAITANMGTLSAGKIITDIGSGVRVEIEAGAAMPFWMGSGTKTVGNSLLYLDSSGNLVARGLLIADPAGNPVIGSGTALDADLIDGLGALALINKITAANATTYIDSAAIPRAVIGALNVGSADIINAAVQTLKIAGNAVTLPVSAFTSGATSAGGTLCLLQTITLTNPDSAAAQAVLLMGQVAAIAHTTTPDRVKSRLTLYFYKGGTLIFSMSYQFGVSGSGEGDVLNCLPLSYLASLNAGETANFFIYGSSFGLDTEAVSYSSRLLVGIAHAR